MRIFDRKFMQYQLAYGVWFNLQSRLLLVVMIFATLSFFTSNLFYLIIIPFFYMYAYFRLQYLFKASDEKFNKRMEKQYTYYERQNAKAQGKAAFQLEKILFAVEMKKISAQQAIGDINEILKTRPKMSKIANGMLLSIHLVAKEEGAVEEIPKHLVNTLEFALDKEDNPNILLDYVRMGLKLETYDVVLQLLDKTEEKNKLYEKDRYPVLRSIYKTSIVAIPYYRFITYANTGEIEKAKEELQKSIETSKSNKLNAEMRLKGEELGILV